jgi:hypothetical protein
MEFLKVTGFLSDIEPNFKSYAKLVFSDKEKLTMCGAL